MTIHLFKGDHFLVENRYDALNIYRQFVSVDQYSMNLNLVIKPLYCDFSINSYGKNPPPEICGDQKVTVYNKIRERLKFEV